MDTVLHAAAEAGSGNGINSLDQILAGLSGTFKDANGTDQQLTLRIANAPFAQRGLQLQEPFLDTLASKYGAGLRLVDFENDPAGACQLIDGWVSDQTEGRIPKLLDSLDSATRLVLVNAIYLKAPWQTPFDESGTKNAPFTRADGSQVSVPTMSLDLSEGSYASGTGWQAIELPYAGGSLAMTIVVPDDLAPFEARPRRRSLLSDHGRPTAGVRGSDATSLQDRDEVRPRVRAGADGDAPGVRSGSGRLLGHHDAGAAVHLEGRPPGQHLGRREGNGSLRGDGRADRGSASPAQRVTLRVDRPFIFAVRDTNTGAILFLGRVVDPSA